MVWLPGITSRKEGKRVRPAVCVLLGILGVIWPPGSAVPAQMELTCCNSSIYVTLPPELPNYRLSEVREECGTSYQNYCSWYFAGSDFKPEDNVISLKVENPTDGYQWGKIEVLDPWANAIDGKSCGTQWGAPDAACKEDLTLGTVFNISVANPRWDVFSLYAYKQVGTASL